MAALSLMFALACGGDPVVQSTASAYSPIDVVGTWETSANDYKWTFSEADGQLQVHGWDSASGGAFSVQNVRWTPSGPAFRTLGPGSADPAIEHELIIVDSDTLQAHCALEDGSELDFQLKRIPGMR
jgi:hypothetical protein